MLESLDLKRFAASTGVPSLNRNFVHPTPVLLPPLDEQFRIAVVLDTVDEAIAKTEAVIAKLKQVRAGLLHDLLTRGLDEHGQLRDPIAHPEQFQDSPLGQIPCDWRILALGDVAEKVQDGTHFSPKTTSGPKRYLTSKNIRFGFLDLSDCGWISEAEHQEIFRRCDVRRNDILLTKDGVNTGNASLNTLDEEFSLLSSVALIRCRIGLSHHEFFLNYLLSPMGQKRLKDLMSGNAITRLTLQKIKNFTVLLPPFEEQAWIAERLEGSKTLIESTEREMAKLHQLKSGLMSDLLTGRVRVPEGITESS
jgi:type I restriction enzyme S subunit